MAHDTGNADRVTEIISLLRPARSPRLPESLTAAATAGDIPAMQLFLERGANPDERSVGFGSPLGAACAVGQLEAARWLIAHGASLDPPGAQFSPIQSALGKANCEAAALLLDAGLPVERAAWGVIAAASLGRLDMLRWLLSRGLDLDGTYPGVGVLRERAIHNARKDADPDLLRFLRGEFDPGPPPAAPPPTPPLRKEHPRAAPEERERLLREACGIVATAGKAAANWNASGPFAPPQRQRLLAFAAATGLAGIVTALLDAGAAPNAVPEGTPPPLTAAAGEAQLDIVKLLLARGALPNGKDGESWLPLASAAQSGDPEVVAALLAAGANPKAKPADRQPLANHARGPRAAEIRALLEDAKAAAGKAAKPRKPKRPD